MGYGGPMRVVIMGVTGCGKSTVARGVADAFGWHMKDGDDLHPASNVAKMSEGIPLTDEDRWPWLDSVGQWLAEHDGAVIACSALKRAYRDRIRDLATGTVFVHLAAPQSVLTERVARRMEAEGHFAGPGLLDSQYATLEGLGFDEVGATLDVSTASPEEVIATAVAFLTDADY